MWVKTAELMSGGKIEIITDEALREVSVGRWEGLSFAEIRERWPELYEARGENMSSVAPPGGESFLHASERFDDALKSIMESNDGNIAIISHSGGDTRLAAPLRRSRRGYVLDPRALCEHSLAHMRRNYDKPSHRRHARGASRPATMMRSKNTIAAANSEEEVIAHAAR